MKFIRKFRLFSNDIWRDNPGSNTLNCHACIELTINSEQVNNVKRTTPVKVHLLCLDYKINILPVYIFFLKYD